MPAVLNAKTGNFRYVYRSDDSSRNCYLLYVPVTDSIHGMVVRDFSSLPDTSNTFYSAFHIKCAEKGYATLITCTSNYYPDLFLNYNDPQLLDSMVEEVMDEYRIPKNKIFVGGISASGSRALRYAEYVNRGLSVFNRKLAGVFVVDSPLDVERFYGSAMGILKRNNPIGMNEEAALVTEVFTNKLNGSPDEQLKAYQNASVFSATDSTGGSAKYLVHQNLIIFHEPDMDWWNNERDAGYYDINSYDIDGMEKFLIKNGNTRITIIKTSGKGFNKKGERNCHSWSIVDEELLLNWILNSE
ncbi:MAG: hypothetical protein GC181_11420 [Bacteroidetes bacterium]|nr:hypothetical protein [Bacteroidota bacterium]